MSVDIRISVGWNIELNTTGIDWTILQHDIKKIVETEALHTIYFDKYYEKPFCKYYEEYDRNVEFYFKFDTIKKQISVVCIKEGVE